MLMTTGMIDDLLNVSNGNARLGVCILRSSVWLFLASTEYDIGN
jgi:hypothetical protein